MGFNLQGALHFFGNCVSKSYPANLLIDWKPPQCIVWVSLVVLVSRT